MFAEDQARIEAWCRNPDKLVRVVTMVLLSIQQQWVSVGNSMAQVDRDGASAACLWGWKKRGYQYARDNKVKLYRMVKAHRRGDIWLDELMREFVKVPGLGIAKAGFVCQLVTGMSGCMDLHNVQRFGLNTDTWQIRTRAVASEQIAEIDDKISLYLHLIDACGGSEKLWDEWCNLLADRYTNTYHNGDDVSRRHWIYLLGLPGD